MNARPKNLALLGAMALGACTPAPITSQGEEISGLYNFFFVAAVVVFVITAGLIGWSIIRYRAKPGDDDLPDQWHSNVGLEVTWFAIPQVLVVVLFVASAIVLGNIDEEPEPDANALMVEVNAFQWGWRFTYPDEDVTVVGLPDDTAEIALPVGRPITFVLTSDDVIHSFYVPRFLTKRDVVPGQINRLQITIDQEGTYDGVCSEFCGLLHARMPFEIEAMSEDGFAQWLEEGADGNG